jgi:flavin-binding protein dodecin
LKDNLDQKFYSWDTTTMPDGAYYLRIRATDSPSNPPDLALDTVRESERFVVDNTPPVIEHLEAAVWITKGTQSFVKGELTALQSSSVKFTARDATSSIERAQYSVDGGDWILVAPVGGISDALEERYEFTLTVGLSPGEHTIAVRAYDRFENVGSAKTTFTVPAAKP